MDSFNGSNYVNLSTVTKLKRSLSHRRKFVKKLPLIRKELQSETSAKQISERLIKTIIDCDAAALRSSLERGTDVNEKLNNWSLLHYACSMIEPELSGTDQHLETIQLLVENGAQINAQDEDRWTPLHLACQLGVTRVISFLIKKGADKDACTIENLRPIDLVEPDNFLALSFLISSVNCIEKQL